jgi:predicted DNA-binding transcriptional regulator AlpA
MQKSSEPTIYRVGPRGAAKQRHGRPKGSKNKRPREEVLAELANDPNTAYLSARQVALRYSVYVGTVRAWVAQGILPAPYQMADNTVRWKRSELDARDAKCKPVRYGRRKEAT